MEIGQKPASESMDRGEMMKKRRTMIFPIVSAVLALFVAARCVHGEDGKPEVLHHDLAVTLHPDESGLVATDVLRVKGNGASTLSLSLAPAAGIRSIFWQSDAVPADDRSPPTAVRQGGGPGLRAQNYHFRQGSLAIPVPAELRTGESLLFITYEANFNDPVEENPLTTEDPSYGVAGVISPRGTFLLSEAGWYPESSGSHPTFRIHIRAPAGIEAVTAGRRAKRETSGGTTESVWEIDHPVQGLALSAGRYVIEEQSAGGIPIYAYFLPETKNLAQTYLTAVADYIGLYTDLIGPYPFPKFAVVENFFPTGYGFPSYTLLGSSVIRLPFIVKTSLGHEVAHSWWGNCVFVDYLHGNWSEGLTTYVADYLYKERSSDEEAREYRMQILRDYAALAPRDGGISLADFKMRHDPATRSIGYGKSAMVFHMVRRRIGDDAFWQGLKTVFREKAFQKASWSDFAEAFRRTGGVDLDPFFREWIERSGAPVLRLQEVRGKEREDGWNVTAKLVQERPYFHDLDVPVSLTTDAETVDYRVILSGRESSFTAASAAPPRKLTVDPQVHVFRRLYPSEIPPTVNSIRGSTSLIAVTARDLPPAVIRASEMILTALGHPLARILPEHEVRLSTLRGHDVVYIGLPRDGTLLPDLPEGLSLSAQRFAMEGKEYETEKDALFVVLSHPLESLRAAAVFLPLSASAAEAAVRKIPHYGKYSVLIFKAGVNQVKSVWPVQSSPLIHSFELQ